MESTSPAASPVLPSSAVLLRPRSSTSAPSPLLGLVRRLPLLLLAYGVPGLITSSQTYFYAQAKDPRGRCPGKVSKDSYRHIASYESSDTSAGGWGPDS